MSRALVGLLPRPRSVFGEDGNSLGECILDNGTESARPKMIDRITGMRRPPAWFITELGAGFSGHHDVGCLRVG